MKKIALIAAMSSLLVLTACQKEVTEVKKGSQVEARHQKLTTNNSADISADMASIEQLAVQQQAKAGDLDQRLNAAVQSQDEEAVKKLFPEFKAALVGNLIELNKLQMKSSEVSELRSKLAEITNVSLELQENMLTKTPEPQKLEQLQNRGMQIQQEIMVISQKIHSITNPVEADAAQGFNLDQQNAAAIAEELEKLPKAPQAAQ